jgi:protein-S-isoprenylcysteine O-methyltransferase Ste14
MAASLRLTSRRLVVYAFILLVLLTASPTLRGLVAGGLIVGAGLAIRIWATGYLQKNHRLTTQGPYAFIRHPLYAGTLLCMVGFLVASSGTSGAARTGMLAILASGVALFFLYYVPYKSRVEGDRLVRRFGHAAERYLRHVPNLLPLRRPYRGEPASWSLRQVLRNSEHWTCFATLAGFLVLWFRMTVA